LAGADSRDIDPGLVPADTAVGAARAYRKAVGLFQGRDSIGHRARGGQGAGRGGVHIEGFMGSVRMAFRPEGIETALLGGPAGGRGAGGVGVQGPGQAFMPPVLLRAAGVNKLWHDA
jgi:hypothetical protein